MAVRKIVQIDEEKCNGCGECIPNCAEGVLQIVDGKARLISDKYCDGLGACLGVCPQDAIRITEREAEDFDQQAVAGLGAGQATGCPTPHRHTEHVAGCPGAAIMEASSEQDGARPAEQVDQLTALSQWPVQLSLVPVNAPFFDGADLLLAADCVPFAMAGFHCQLLRGKKLLVGCPKLDDYTYYADKLAEILKQNDIRSLTVVHMEVPCCFALMELARRALAASCKQVWVEEITVGIRGHIKERRALTETENAKGGAAMAGSSTVE